MIPTYVSLRMYIRRFNAPGPDSIYHLVNGRIILKKVTLPEYKRNVSVQTPGYGSFEWRYAGINPALCFVLPNASGINLFEYR